jgi:hypothetical protein
MAIDKTNAITPPNLLGIARKIAYANKKYHSGLMCVGVTKGLAGIKFSGSPRTQGSLRDKITNPPKITTHPTMSLEEK